MLFNKNTVTGTPRSFHRDGDGGLLVTLHQADGEDISVFVYDELASQLELLLFQRRMEKRPVTLTLEYDPRTGRVTNFSIVS